MSKPQFHYVTELHDHDVVLGRGSGPNDRQGNINFRSLCKERKIAYIEATSRDEKGRIAADIVATVHGRGGRFFKRLSADQAKKGEFQCGGEEAVYEVADEQTSLEKTKQTLRQNRADFVAKVEKEVGRAPVVGAYPIHRRKGDDKLKQDMVKSNDGGTADGIIGTADGDIMNNVDPIPLGESCGLDSLNFPVMTNNSATMLLAALFGSSDNTPIQSNNQPQDVRLGSTQRSGPSAMSIQGMSGLLHDLLGKRSNRTETDSAQLFQSIMHECGANEDMAEQLVSALIKDSHSQQSSISFTGQQKALLLRYEQMQDHQWMSTTATTTTTTTIRPPHNQQPFGQYQLGEETANSGFEPGSVFSSLVRQYKDDNEPNQYDNESNQLSDLQQDFLANGSPTGGSRRRRALERGHTVAGGELIEPANYLDESMDISVGAARDLTKALGGSSLTNVCKTTNSRELSSSSSNKTKNRRRAGSLDSSLLSMMSLSISETGGGSWVRREGSRGAPDEVKIKEQSDKWNSFRNSDLIVDAEKDFPF